MILRALELRYFGKFSARTFEFRHGMNLIAGPNEAGKTTLMEAIPAVLFGTNDKERFKTWGGDGSCVATLVFEEQDRLVRIERDILTDQVLLTEHDSHHQELARFAGVAAAEGHDLSPGSNEYYAQLNRLFGLAEADLFRASLYVGQGDLKAAGRSAMPAGIRELISGFAEVDCDTALASIAADLSAITRLAPWDEERSGDRQLEELEGQLAEVDKRCREARNVLAELEPLRCEMAALETSIRIDRDEYAKGERYLAWVRKQWQLDEDETPVATAEKEKNGKSAATRIAELEKQRREVEKELSKTGLPREIPPDLVKILVDADEERKELVALQSESAALRQKLLQQKFPPWKGRTVLSVLLLLVGGLVGRRFPDRMGQSLLGAGLVAALIWILYLLRAGKAKTEQSRIQGQAQVLEHKREEAQARLALLDERFEQLGMSPSAVEIVKMQKNLATHQELLERLKEVEIGLKVLEEERQAAADEELFATSAMADGDNGADRKPLPKGLLPLEELPGAELKLQALEGDLWDREERLRELARREAELRDSLGDLLQLDEERQRLKERQRRLLSRRDTLVTAFELLNDSVTEFRRAHLEQLAEEVGNYLAVATGGRYVRVRFDENFSLFVQGRDTEGWQAVSALSRGTIDAAGFGLRLALTRYLSQGRRLPLLLDDPLVNLDADRLGETLAVLENLAREHQVLLSTHNDGVIKRAGAKRWHVVSLDEAKSSRNRMNGERKDDVGQLHLL